jgi:hypothetical protein
MSRAGSWVIGWASRAGRDVALNIVGFLLVVAAAGILGAGIRGVTEWLVERGWVWPALIGVLLSGLAWAVVFGLFDKEHLRNPEGRILPLPALGLALGTALVWVYIFAGLSYTLARLGAIQYAAAQPETLLPFLTDAYMWSFLALLPGLDIPKAIDWESPVELQGGRRGVLLVLFRTAVIYQVFAKARELMKQDEPAAARG